METRYFGTGSGGIGTSVLQLALGGAFETSAQMLTMIAENSNSPLYVQELTMASGENTIAVPSKASGFLLVPDGLNTRSVEVRASTGVAGFTLAPLGVMMVTFPSSPPSNVYLNWTGPVYSAQAVTVTNASDIVNLTSHTFQNGDRVMLGAATAPTGITLGEWYYVVGSATNSFQLATSYGGAAVDMTSDGTSVTVTASRGFKIYWL